MAYILVTGSADYGAEHFMVPNVTINCVSDAFVVKNVNIFIPFSAFSQVIETGLK